MKCFTCRGGMKEGTVNHFIDLKTCMVIVKNVPCLECEQCGEIYFTDPVAKRLDEIIEAASKPKTEISVVEYS